MLRMPVHRQHLEHWRRCTLLRARRQLWHSCTVICETLTGSLKQSVLSQSSPSLNVMDSPADEVPLEDTFSDREIKNERMRSSIELPSIRTHLSQDVLPPFHAARPRELLPSIMARSPPERSSTLPPIQRRDKPARPRKSSITQNARKPKHERTKSKEQARRLSIDGRKAFSAEPQSAASALGKRWEDLIEAATSATEADDDRDLTPVRRCPSRPDVKSTNGIDAVQIPQSPQSTKRSSLPPFPTAASSHFHSFAASPLQRALTPPPPDPGLEPFPSVESSIESIQSGRNFHIHMPSSALTNNSDSSPVGSAARIVQIYCAACGAVSALKDSYACTECICGLCLNCVDVMMGERQRGRSGCPRCGVFGGRFKPFQLDLR